MDLRIPAFYAKEVTERECRSDSLALCRQDQSILNFPCPFREQAVISDHAYPNVFFSSDVRQRVSSH